MHLTVMEKENLYLQQDFLSDIELYYSPEDNFTKDKIVVVGDEVKHISQVMRHTKGDIIFITNGMGKIFKAKIFDFPKNAVVCDIIEIFNYSNMLDNICFCIPRLKSQERFDFAVEKCIELGITNFIIYDAERSVARGEKLEKWNKQAVAAMKQSLRSFRPKIEYAKSIGNISKMEGEKFWFDQKAETLFTDIVTKIKVEKGIKYFIFGPEGGFSEKEKELLEHHKTLKLTENRLRAETAVMSAAVILQ